MKYIILLNGNIKTMTQPTEDSNRLIKETYEYLILSNRVFDSEYDAQRHLRKLRHANRHIDLSTEIDVDY